MRRTLAQRFREAASKFETFGTDDIALKLGVRTYAEMEKLRSALKGLVRNGEVISLRPGFYRYAKKEKPLSMVAKMWRAMLIKGSFTRRDIGRLSGASITHVHKYFMKLEREGLIVNTSGKRGYKDGVFQLADPDDAPLKHPRSPKTQKAGERKHLG
jgi:hypothetical protein